MSGLDHYAADALAGLRQGAADIGRSAIADIGDSYQEVLLSGASISPADGLTATMESTTVEIDAPPAVDIAPPAPEIDIE